MYCHSTLLKTFCKRCKRRCVRYQVVELIQRADVLERLLLELAAVQHKD